MTEISSTNRSPSIKNPAPHRGFSSKAREILIEPTSKLFSNSIRHSSEHELLASRTMPSFQNQSKLERTDSQQTNGSQKSHSSTQSYPEMAEEFDSLEDLPKKCGKGKAKKMLGDIGKTRSAGDLLKASTAAAAKKHPATLIRTFQQLNIMRLPSVDSVNSDHSKSLTRLNQINDPIFDDLTTSRQKAYEMK